MSKALELLAKATDTKGYPDDKDPAHWRTIRHSKVHIDETGHIDGGAGGKFHGKKWTSVKHPHKPESYKKPKGAADLRKAWAAVAKERMEIHRAKTEKGRKAHEEKLAAAYKEYSDMRAEIEARDPAEAAKFKPRTAGAASSPKRSPLESLAKATAPKVSAEADTFRSKGISAVQAYAKFKKSGKAEDLQKAQAELKEASAAMNGIADVDEAKAMRADIIEECKKLGLKSDKLRDLFREIKGATAVSSPLAELAKSTSGYTGRSKYGGVSPTATTKEISAWRKTYPTLKKFEQHAAESGKEIEEELLKAGATKAEIEQFKKDMQRIIDQSDYAMQVDSTILRDEIMAPGGKFKSQFEVGDSRGLYDPSTRAEVGARLFGCEDKVDAVPKYTREKYGFMISKDIGDKLYPDQYGDCTIRFKKDKLKGKVTFTAYDSLDHQWHARGKTSAGDVDNVSLAGFRGATTSEILSMMKAARTATTASQVMDYHGSGDRYLELQFHEDQLDMGCVDSVTFHRDPDRETVKKLKAMGIKCYRSRWGMTEELT